MSVLPTLMYHVRQAAIAAGVKWSSDCDAELERVTETIERRFERFEQQVTSLTERGDTPDDSRKPVSGVRASRV